MMSDPKLSATGVTEEKGGQRQGSVVEHSEVLVNRDLMNDAYDGENREHQMRTWEAVKTHPWACLWAFIMCFTIVSFSDCRSPAFGFTRKCLYLGTFVHQDQMQS